MHAAVIDRFGGPEVLTLHQLALPAVEEGEVLIALDTARVGSWDAENAGGLVSRWTTPFPAGSRDGRLW
jgi:NADPH2:quinone reductase